MLRAIPFTIIFAITLFFANTAEAASLLFVPSNGNFGIGKEITVDLRINSEGAGINAAQATLRFPKDILNVKSIDKSNSAFNFWLEEPTYSNSDGVISFVGGTPYGISGASIEVLHIVFTVKSAGAAPISIVDSAVTASDGSGTNVLSKTTDASFTVSPEATTAPVPVVPAPVQITRTPEPASGLPTKPAVTVALYPDQTGWSNASNIFTAQWTLPADISGVQAVINKQPNYIPSGSSEGLFESKSFAALSDGTWYLHVRFRNNIGWGETTHYRIAVDTVSPLPFNITSPESNPSENPAPVFNFKTNDALSGIKEYQVKIDNEGWVVIPIKGFKGSSALNFTNPGQHHVIIRAYDYAGNAIENSIDHEVSALPSPILSFATDNIYTDEAKGLHFMGTALPGSNIILLVKKGIVPVISTTVPVDKDGNWNFTSDQILASGTYAATIQTEDSRGARSLVVTAPAITVAWRYTNLVTTTIIVLIIVILGGYWFFRTRRNRTSLRIQVAENDTSKVFKMIEEDLEKLKNARETSTLADDEFIIEKMSDNVRKMSGYIKDTIKKAKD